MKIILSGCTGSMGRVITDMVTKSRTEFDIVAGFANKKEDGFDYPVYEDMKDIKEEADVILDFSSHNCLDYILNYALEKKLPVVIASTGYDDHQIGKIEKASMEIPILFSGNMSIGVNILLNVVETLARDLEGFDIEIVEKHHRRKTDSPSGTANMLFDSVNKGRNETLYKNEGRKGVDLHRTSEEVGMHAMRGGTITGEHSVFFAGLDEIIEVRHRATSKKIFATGALKACKFISEREDGLYDMRDIFTKSHE